MSKDETRKKQSITQKDLKPLGWKKILIRGIKIFNWRVKLNWKIAIIKGKKIKNNGQTKKKQKKLIEWWNWKIKKFQQQRQKKYRNEKQNIWELRMVI